MPVANGGGDVSDQAAAADTGRIPTQPIQPLPVFPLQNVNGWHCCSFIAAAWLVLLIALLLTALAWFNARHRVQQSGNDRFVSAAPDLQQAIVDRIHAYELVLRSASGLFAASDGGPH